MIHDFFSFFFSFRFDFGFLIKAQHVWSCWVSIIPNVSHFDRKSVWNRLLLLLLLERLHTIKSITFINHLNDNIPNRFPIEIKNNFQTKTNLDADSSMTQLLEGLFNEIFFYCHSHGIFVFVVITESCLIFKF